MTSTEEDVNKPQIASPSLLRSSRLVIALMSMVAFFCAILATINVGIAIVCINKRSSTANHSWVAESLSNNCSETGENIDETVSCTSNIIEEELYVDKPAQGMLIGAVYYGVVAVQLVFGWICDKYGWLRFQMITGTAVLGIASLLSPVILEHLGIPYFFVVRIIKGIAMSAMICPIVPLQVRWSTPRDQGLLVGISSAGLGIANAVTYPISGLLCQFAGWRSIFYFAGILCVIWVVVAFFLVHDSPTSHPRISVEEKQYFVSYSQSSSKKDTKASIPWKQIFLSVPVWATVVTNFFFFAATKGTVLNLPIFIKDVLEFSVAENGIFSALPLITALALHFIIGPALDYVRRKEWFSLTTIRKGFHLTGTLIPAVFMFVISQIPPDQKHLIIGLIAVGYGLNEVAWMGGFYFCIMDMAPDYVGILQGISKTIGLAPGFIIPAVISALTPNGTSDEWSNVFMVFGGVYAISGLVFAIGGSAELQSWGKMAQKPKALI